MKTTILTVACLVFLSGAVREDLMNWGIAAQQQTNATGNDIDEVIATGSTGADTIHSNSAVGGNSARPELRFPNSSAR